MQMNHNWQQRWDENKTGWDLVGPHPLLGPLLDGIYICEKNTDKLQNQSFCHLSFGKPPPLGMRQILLKSQLDSGALDEF
jgi:hypothetical protein